jgi:hypothetical protein
MPAVKEVLRSTFNCCRYRIPGHWQIGAWLLQCRRTLTRCTIRCSASVFLLWAWLSSQQLAFRPFWMYHPRVVAVSRQHEISKGEQSPRLKRSESEFQDVKNFETTQSAHQAASSASPRCRAVAASHTRLLYHELCRVVVTDWLSGASDVATKSPSGNKGASRTGTQRSLGCNATSPSRLAAAVVAAVKYSTRRVGWS